MTRLPLLIALALVLAGCGKVGNLDQPAPLYGEQSKAKYAAQQKAAAEAKAKKESNEPEPLPDQQYDPTKDVATQRAAPVPGTNPDPSGAAQPGVLPDPFTRPQ